ncbi:MAG: hypothetical protein IV093_19090 [Rubrivivax sp.]|nr:hypothetical protein [Rubrivivax sp.]
MSVFLLLRRCAATLGTVLMIPPLAMAQTPAPAMPDLGVFGIQLGGPVQQVPRCQVAFEPPRSRFSPVTCFESLGSGDVRRLNPVGTLQVFFSQADHPQWMGTIGGTQPSGLTPSLLLDYRAGAITRVRFRSPQQNGPVALELLRNKYGQPGSERNDSRSGLFASWALGPLTVSASCPIARNPGEHQSLAIVQPPCDYVVELASARASEEEDRARQQQQERQRLQESGRKL